MKQPDKPLRGPLRKRNSLLWERHPEDWYVEPAWVSARLFQAEVFEGGICDPACGMGRIVRAAREAGLIAWGSDIVDRGGLTHGMTRDFMTSTTPVANIVCNPPFSIAERFVAHALRLAERKVAMILPSSWVQGDRRSRWLEQSPLRRIYYITPRPSMPPGDKADDDDVVTGNGTTDYAWFVWLRGYDGRAETCWVRRDPDAPMLDITLLEPMAA